MTVKITAKSPSQLEEHIKNVLNMATIFVRGGKLPEEQDILRKETHGQWWTYDSKSTYEIYQATNDYKAFVKDKCLEGENIFIVLDFFYRYENKKNSFNTLMSEMTVLMLGEEVAEILP